MRILLTLASLLLLFASSCLAEDLYIAQSSAGLNDGSSCANARAYTFFNTAGNWGAGAGKISAGDTVHLCGTVYGSASDSSRLVVQGDGSAGNVITIIFESSAKLSTTVLSAYGKFLDLGSHGYITIDGNGVGIIELTDNGSGKNNQVICTGISGEGGSNITIKNFASIGPIYLRTPGGHGAQDSSRYGTNVSLQGSHILVQNNYITDNDTLVDFNWLRDSYSDMKIKNNTLVNGNHLINIGASSLPPPYLDGLEISGNTLDHTDTWECDACGTYHLDGIIIFNECPSYAGNLTNLKIFNNYFGPHVGTSTTAAIFLDWYVPEQAGNIWIFNNLLTINSSSQWNDGFIFGSAKVFNNTIYAPLGSMGAGGLFIKNNIVDNGASSLTSDGNSGPYALVTSDYNVKPTTSIIPAWLSIYGFTGRSGSFSVGETITSSSGGSGVLFDTVNDDRIRMRTITDTRFEQSDTITGGTSHATATLEATNSFQVTFLVTSPSGSFTAGELLNFSPSGSTARYLSIAGPDQLSRYTITAQFPTGVYNPYGDTITGATSGKTASVVSFIVYPQSLQFDWTTQWVAAPVSQDTHTQTGSSPTYVNATGGDFRLASNDTVARGKGVNLTSECAAVPELCFDKNGVARPATGPWDIGAYEYSGGSSPSSSCMSGAIVRGGVIHY